MRSLIRILFFGIALCIGLIESYAQVLPKINNKDQTKTPSSTDKKNFDLKELTQSFPKIIKKNPSGDNTTSKRTNIELREFDEVGYLQTLASKTDSLLFQNTVDLERIRSIIAEDPFSMDWAPSNELIETAEQILVDSVWITAFEYFSNWALKRTKVCR